ncbi:hypothetical protein CDIK_0518 [Cucumispora dikerogammari]|nr:hypothetical protein CDIK_0518 [Cucumispora dikerogammari]
MTSLPTEPNTYPKTFVNTMNADSDSNHQPQDATLSEIRKEYDGENLYYTNNIDCIKMKGLIVLILSKIDYSYEEMFTLTLYDEYGSIKGCCSLELIREMNWKIGDALRLKNCSVWENTYLNITKQNVVVEM